MGIEDILDAHRHPVQRGVVGVGGLARVKDRQFGGHGLAHDDGARLAQQRHRGGVACGLAAGVQDRAIFGRHVMGIEDILDAHRHPVQRAQAGSRLAPFLCGLGLGQGVFLVQVGPGADGVLDLLYAVEARSHQFFRSQLAVADFAGGVGGGQTGRSGVLRHEFIR